VILPPGPHYVPSKTVEEFIYAVLEGPPLEWRLLILQGARGEGKTTGVIMACAAMAEELRVKGFKEFPLIVAVVRDTWENLKRTTLAAFKENRARGMPIEIFDGGKQATFGNPESPAVHFWFFGLDQAADADKLQGFTCGILVLEEVAPAAGLATGVPPEALGIGATSVRQAGVLKRILVPMNPPDEDHWILKVEKHLEEQGLAFIKVKRFEMEPGEKSRHFERLAAMTEGEEAERWTLAADEFDAYRMANQAFLESIGRGDLVQRLVGGQVGFAQMRLQCRRKRCQRQARSGGGHDFSGLCVPLDVPVHLRPPVRQARRGGLHPSSHHDDRDAAEAARIGLFEERQVVVEVRVAARDWLSHHDSRGRLTG
jgi:hypothetical protein